MEFLCDRATVIQLNWMWHVAFVSSVEWQILPWQYYQFGFRSAKLPRVELKMLSSQSHSVCMQRSNVCICLIYFQPITSIKISLSLSHIHTLPGIRLIRKEFNSTEVKKYRIIFLGILFYSTENNSNFDISNLFFTRVAQEFITVVRLITR